MQDSGGQQFLIGRHCGYNFYGFHGMNDVGEPLFATLSSRMGVKSKHNGAV
jgi:hypothetical protein